jgi:predicted DNA-binding transcriptional regulator AlpA
MSPLDDSCIADVFSSMWSTSDYLLGRLVAGMDQNTTVSSHSTLREVSSRAQLADYVGIATQTLARWATEGKGPKFVRAGGRVLYRRDDVTAWLDSLEKAS